MPACRCSCPAPRSSRSRPRPPSRWPPPLGYDGIEVMVWTDAVSQDAGALRGLAEHYGVPVLSVHAPCLLVTQRVWSPDPWERLRRSAELAETLGAPTVVVHPPFTWQRDYARGVRRRPRRLRQRAPWRAVRGGEHVPGADGRAASSCRTRPAGTRPRPATTRTPSTCRTARPSRIDALAMADAMGAGLAHVHLGDGTGEGRDEHLVPGRGAQPCARAAALAGRRAGFTGAVAVEVATRRARPAAPTREADLRARRWPSPAAPRRVHAGRR